MNWQSITFNWNQARAFLATAEEGSLSAAARALGMTQPTLGRQVSALEEELGVTLFERVGRALVLTDAGHQLLAHVRAMGEAASHFSLTATGQSQQASGHVAISATDIMSVMHLPQILRRLRDAAPGIRVTVVAQNEISDLLRREADIAIRHARPTEPDLFARKVGETTGHLYATTEYLQRAGWPQTPEELARCTFVGYDNHAEYVSIMAQNGLQISESNIQYASGHGPTAWGMIRAGLGIGPMSRDIAQLSPDMQIVLPELVIPIPVWLIAHRELHTAKRIRVVFDLLAEELAKLV
ncbi:MAG: LysR family transcriptional regulator [Litoreibacter sp.]|nr:LysR family transcriptional regulator [Litoreibacter sp.]